MQFITRNAQTNAMHAMNAKFLIFVKIRMLQRERGQAHPLGGRVGPTPHGGAAHTPAAPSYGVAAWWVMATSW